MSTEVTLVEHVAAPVHIGRLTAAVDDWKDPATEPHGEYGEGWRMREDGTYWAIGGAGCWRCTACETVMPPGGRWARCHICMTPQCGHCRQGVEEVQEKRATRRRSDLVVAQERLLTASNRVCEICETASMASFTAEADMLDCSVQWTGGWPSIVGLGVWQVGGPVGVTRMCLPEHVELRAVRISETDVGVRPARAGTGHIGTATVGWCSCGARPAVWVTRLGGTWRGAAYVRCAQAERKGCDFQECVRFWAAAPRPAAGEVVVQVVPWAPAILGQSVYGESVCLASMADGSMALPSRGGVTVEPLLGDTCLAAPNRAPEHCGNGGNTGGDANLGKIRPLYEGEGDTAPLIPGDASEKGHRAVACTPQSTAADAAEVLRGTHALTLRDESDEGSGMEDCEGSSGRWSDSS